MPTAKLDEVSRRLLHAGIAAPYVRAYVRELREHFEDCVHDELARGACHADAEARADARLGSVENLAQSVLSQPALRSASARHPALFFGAGPTLVWLSSFVITLWTIRLMFAGASAQFDTAWAVAAHFLCILYVRVSPVILSVAMLTTSSRQLVDAHWPVLGVVLLNLLAGMFNVELVEADPLCAQLNASSPLAPFVLAPLARHGATDLAVSLGRSLAMLAFTACGYVSVQRLGTRLPPAV